MWAFILAFMRVPLLRLIFCHGKPPVHEDEYYIIIWVLPSHWIARRTYQHADSARNAYTDTLFLPRNCYGCMCVGSMNPHGSTHPASREGRRSRPCPRRWVAYPGLEFRLAPCDTPIDLVSCSGGPGPTHPAFPTATSTQAPGRWTRQDATGDACDPDAELESSSGVRTEPKWARDAKSTLSPCASRTP